MCIRDSWGIKRNEWSVTEEGILNGFQKIDSVKESPEGIDCFKGVLDEEIKIVRTRKNEYHAKTVILATSAEHRALNVPGEKELTPLWKFLWLSLWRNSGVWWIPARPPGNIA